MAWGAVASFVTGELVTAARMNELKDNFDFLGALTVFGTAVSSLSASAEIHGARAVVSNTANQSIPDGTLTDVAFDEELSDPENWHDNSTNNARVTPDIAGAYLLTAWLNYASDPSNGSAVRIYKNTTEVASNSRIATSVNNAMTAMVELNGSTDYIKVVTRQDSGGALNLLAGALLSVALIG